MGRKDKKMPLLIPKIACFILFFFGLITYIVFTLGLMIPDGRFFDIGLFSFCLVPTLLGLVGFWVLKEEEKKRIEDS